ncbi:MAG TPA: PIN domain-containing protein [Burkholderiaceae bacterium]|jgi:predicted nucleic acid-binding protein|nr:PIN domain-containing protein [Burkholderiaceae bacterium]
MTAPVFVDANVLVYARDAGDATRQPRAQSWLEWLWREQLGRTSMQVLSEYYVTVTRKLRPGLPAEQAWDDVEALMHWSPQPIDRATMARARTIEVRHRLSWWDALVVSAAREQGCAVLLTEDLQDGALVDGVRIRNPFTHSIEEHAAEPYGGPDGRPPTLRGIRPGRRQVAR